LIFAFTFAQAAVVANSSQTMASAEQPLKDPRESLPEITRAAIDYEESQWSNGSVLNDPFYIVPKGSAEAAPGTLLKVEKDVNTSTYTLPPATALSRIIFQSKTLNGSSVPASGYILWPYSARTLSDGFAVVVWTHGTSGIGPNCAPSNIRNLHQHFLAPYQLALQGYVVVAPDYAGLGVGKDESGRPIAHEYLATQSQANDVFYSMQAAQTAFPELSKHFVVIGHSQGGGVAWACAQRQAVEPVHGYLGAVAVSPLARALEQPEPTLSLIGVSMIPSISAAYPEFKPEEILTAEGQQRLDLTRQIGGCIASSASLLVGGQLLKPGWTENTFVQKFQDLVMNGGKKIQGPLLVIHGEVDPQLSVNVTTNAVNKTMELFPSSQLEYVRLPGVSHVPALNAAQRLWMDWIAERFANVAPKPYCKGVELVSARPTTSYQPELNWFIGLATAFYQTV
jgi:pimeloyl-ACP methyl ester carboxylesterase